MPPFESYTRIQSTFNTNQSDAIVWHQSNHQSTFCDLASVQLARVACVTHSEFLAHFPISGFLRTHHLRIPGTTRILLLKTAMELTHKDLCRVCAVSWLEDKVCEIVCVCSSALAYAVPPRSHSLLSPQLWIMPHFHYVSFADPHKVSVISACSGDLFVII